MCDWLYVRLVGIGLLVWGIILSCVVLIGVVGGVGGGCLFFKQKTAYEI